MDLPKISCLTITRNRPELLRRSFEYYRRQTWPNKELVVVVDSREDTGWAGPFFASIDRADVRHALSPPIEHLGALRNLSVEMAAGDLVCTWDDDDLYHPLRLETQAKAMIDENAQASYLDDALWLIQDSGDLFLTHWHGKGFPPSMMAEKGVMPRYREILMPEMGEKGSDMPVRAALLEKHKVALVRERPWLYTQVYHGRNVWSRWHHVSDAFGFSLDRERATRSMAGLAERLKEYFPFPPPEAILCSDGSRVPLT